MDPVGEKDEAQADPDSSYTAIEVPAYPAKDLSFYIVILCLCVCGFVSALDTIILSSTLPAIAASLQATTADAYWCSAAFLFAQSVVQLIYAAFAHAFSRRACVLTALSIFTAASVLCATAKSIQWLIATRTVGQTLIDTFCKK
jgi:MFS family permease